MLIWLLLYEPVALAGALDQGDLSVVAQALGTALLKTVAALFRYL
jgi:biopolymer transport protein ExbB/TolQ